jgi:ribosome biogenesis GTPase
LPSFFQCKKKRGEVIIKNHYTLSDLGWSHFFQQQLSLEDYEKYTPYRVFGVERSILRLIGDIGSVSLDVMPSMEPITVGDWLLLDSNHQFHRLLDRFSLFSRRAAGTEARRQLMSANVDVAFLVTSLNQDFNLNRLERYLALANEANVEPVIVLTKVDCCDNPQQYIEEVQSLGALIDFVAVNSLDGTSLEQLTPWCQVGKTIAFLGSSGVGKSTLINTLSGLTIQRTSDIRQDDDKGRHTTTSRSLHVLPTGALLLDTPGMRELQLLECEHGLEETFSDIAELAQSCKFADCKHEQEPGCMVRKAIEDGNLDPRRLESYRKLLKEQAFNTASLAERRAKDRQFGKHVKSVMKGKNKLTSQ